MSVFDTVEAFTIVRGGYLDITVLGAMQVSEKGDLANWLRPGRLIGGIGGAMDIVAGAKRVIAAMEHTDKKGNPKIVRECTSPLTAVRCVNMIITDMAVSRSWRGWADVNGARSGPECRGYSSR